MNKTSTKINSTVIKSSRSLSVVILIVCLLGLAVAVELTLIHYRSHTDPEFSSICAINDALNCETVARSPYSVFLGLPISVWGLFAYSFLTVLVLYQWIAKTVLDGIFFIAFSAALVASAILAYISMTIIESLCLFCTTLYVVNTVLFVVGVVAVRRRRVNLFSIFKTDFTQIFKKLRFFIPFGLNTVLLLVFTLAFYPRYWQQTSFDIIPKMNTGIDKDKNHWIGAKNPKVTIVEYSDYECPFCRRAHLQMRMMLARYADEVRLVHKQMPMDNKCNDYLEKPFHQRACEFAKSVECAGQQGKFWEMNDALFGIQDTVSAKNIDLDGLLSQLKIDKKAHDTCMKSAQIAKKIGSHIDMASRLEIPGTPTFFYGAQPYPGGIPEQTLKKILARKK